MTVRVLIIEDEKLIRWSLRQKFEAREYQVTEVETGEEAQKALDAGVTSSCPESRGRTDRRSSSARSTACDAQAARIRRSRSARAGQATAREGCGCVDQSSSEAEIVRVTMSRPRVVVFRHVLRSFDGSTASFCQGFISRARHGHASVDHATRRQPRD